MQINQDIENFITDERESSWENVIGNLKFIGSVREGMKIDVQSMQTMNNDYWTKAWRTVLSRGESRKGALKFIKDVIARALQLCSNYIDSDDVFFQGLGKTVGVEIQDALCGVQALCKTYADDAAYVAKLNALIILVDAKMKEMYDSHPDIIVIKERVVISKRSVNTKC